MCFDCQRRWQEDHEQAMKMATEHLDSLGVPEDSLIRGLANIQMACTANPMLMSLMREMYPTVETLTS